MAPIIVHASMLMCLFGFAQGALGGWKGLVMCPEGGEFVAIQASSEWRGRSRVLVAIQVGADQGRKSSDQLRRDSEEMRRRGEEGREGNREGSGATAW